MGEHNQGLVRDTQGSCSARVGCTRMWLLTYPKRKVERQSNATKISSRERKPRTRDEMLDYGFVSIREMQSGCAAAGENEAYSIERGPSKHPRRRERAHYPWTIYSQTILVSTNGLQAMGDGHKIGQIVVRIGSSLSATCNAPNLGAA